MHLASSSCIGSSCSAAAEAYPAFKVAVASVSDFREDIATAIALSSANLVTIANTMY